MLANIAAAHVAREAFEVALERRAEAAAAAGAQDVGIALPLWKRCSCAAPKRWIATELPEAQSPPSRPHGLHFTRSICELNRRSWRARTTCSQPSPPRKRPAPPESGRSA